MSSAAAVTAPHIGRDAVAFSGDVLLPDEAAARASSLMALAECAVEGNAFFHPDFLLPAIAYLAPPRIRIAAPTAGGRVIAMAPFTTVRLGGLFPAARVWTHPYGPLGAPILDRKGVDEAAHALMTVLGQAGGAVMVPDLPLDGAVADALVRAAAAAGRPVSVVARSTRAVWLAGASPSGGGAPRLSRRRRHEYARLLRRLTERGHVRLDAVSDARSVAEAFRDFLAIEASGWKGRAGTALAADPARRDFARRAVERLAEAGAVRIHTLRVDGRPIASLITIVSARTAFTWKIAYDETYAEASPGAQVMLAAVRDLTAEPTIRTIDSCAGADHPLADVLLPDRTVMGTLVIAPAGQGPAFRAALAAERLNIAAAATAKDVRRGLRGLIRRTRTVRS